MVRQALPKFSDTLTLSQPGGGGRLCPPIGFASPKNYRDYALDVSIWSTDKSSTIYLKITKLIL